MSIRATSYCALAFLDLCFLCFLVFLAALEGAASAAGAALGAAAGAAGAAGATGAGVCAVLKSGVDKAAALKSVIKSLFIIIKSKKINQYPNCLINQRYYKRGTFRYLIAVANAQLTSLFIGLFYGVLKLLCHAA